MDQVADWQAWVKALSIRLLGLRSLAMDMVFVCSTLWSKLPLSVFEALSAEGVWGNFVSVHGKM